MDTSRVSFGEMVAAAGGVALLVLMFLPWFGGRLSGIGAPVKVPTRTGWESFGTLFEFLLVVAIAIAIGIAVARAMDSLPPLPLEQGTLVFLAGVALFVIVALRLIDPPDVIDVDVPGLDLSSERMAPAFGAALATLAVAVGGYAQGRER